MCMSTIVCTSDKIFLKVIVEKVIHDLFYLLESILFDFSNQNEC